MLTDLLIIFNVSMNLPSLKQTLGAMSWSINVMFDNETKMGPDMLSKDSRHLSCALIWWECATCMQSQTVICWWSWLTCLIIYICMQVSQSWPSGPPPLHVLEVTLLQQTFKWWARQQAFAEDWYNDLFVRIKCGGAGTRVKHAGQGVQRTGKQWVKLTCKEGWPCH